MLYQWEGSIPLDGTAGRTRAMTLKASTFSNCAGLSKTRVQQALTEARQGCRGNTEPKQISGTREGNIADAANFSFDTVQHRFDVLPCSHVKHGIEALPFCLVHCIYTNSSVALGAEIIRDYERGMRKVAPGQLCSQTIGGSEPKFILYGNKESAHTFL